MSTSKALAILILFLFVACYNSSTHNGSRSTIKGSMTDTRGRNSFRKALKICDICGGLLVPPEPNQSQRCWVASKMSFMNRSQNNATTGTLSIQLLSSSLSVVNYSKLEKNEVPRTSTRNINLRNGLFLLSDQCLSAKSDRDEIYQQSCHEKRCFGCQPIDLVSSKCMVRDVCGKEENVTEMCAEPSHFLYKQSLLLRRGARIINGQNARIEEHPWAVYIKWQDGHQNGVWKKCAGSIISDKEVLTARHCLDTAVGGFIYFGHSNRTKPRQDNGTKLAFARFHVKLHPNQKIDVAILNFHPSTPFKYHKLGIKPILLPTPGQMVETKERVTVIGWGDMCRDPPECLDQRGSPEILQAVSITVESRASCKSRGVAPLWEFCAGGMLNGIPQDACGGDSGGTVECANIDGQKRVCGVVSEGPEAPKCGRSPGTYVNVGHPEVMKFIRPDQAVPKSDPQFDISPNLQPNLPLVQMDFAMWVALLYMTA